MLTLFQGICKMMQRKDSLVFMAKQVSRDCCCCLSKADSKADSKENSHEGWKVHDRWILKIPLGDSKACPPLLL